MADEVKPKRVRARVVCHQYGRHVRGDLVDVDEREYRRVGPRVLLSKEDEEAERRAAEERRARTEARLGRAKASVSGWADKEAEALRVVRQRYLDEQQRQRELLVGAEPERTATRK